MSSLATVNTLPHAAVLVVFLPYYSYNNTTW